MIGMYEARQNKEKVSRIIKKVKNKSVRQFLLNSRKRQMSRTTIQLNSNVFSFTVGGGVSKQLIGRRLNVAFSNDQPTNRVYQRLHNGAWLVWVTFSNQYSKHTIRTLLSVQGLTILAVEEGRHQLT